MCKEGKFGKFLFQLYLGTSYSYGCCVHEVPPKWLFEGIPLVYTLGWGGRGEAPGPRTALSAGVAGGPFKLTSVKIKRSQKFRACAALATFQELASHKGQCRSHLSSQNVLEKQGPASATGTHPRSLGPSPYLLNASSTLSSTPPPPPTTALPAQPAPTRCPGHKVSTHTPPCPVFASYTP